MEAGNSAALRFQVVLLVALPFQRQLDVCLFFSSEYNYQQQNVSLFIHLVCNEDMEADINSTRLPAWLDHQSYLIFLTDFMSGEPQAWRKWSF